jgi:mRNA interferase MazF
LAIRSPTISRVRRGEVWWVNFDPALGQEIQKRRPAIIVSNDLSNRYLSRFQVVPLTSSTSRVYPSEALVKVGVRVSKAMADQIATASRERFGGRIGRVSDEDMRMVDKAIRIQLGLTTEQR